jgi:hypothetical protein
MANSCYTTLNLGYWSASTSLTLQCTELRNGAADEAPGLTTLRMVFGELCYAALLIASLVETLVRGILSILAILAIATGCCKTDDSFFIVRGAALSLQNIGCCLNALLKNVTTKTLAYKDLKLCNLMWQTYYNTPVEAALN